jgi:hypothetical protein
MTNAELVKYAQDFRDGMLKGKDSEGWCYAVSRPLESLLRVGSRIESTLTKGSVAGAPHYWLTLDDGRILDPTADQFKKPKGSTMPPVFLGERPSWYAGADCKATKPDKEHAEFLKLLEALVERGVGGEAQNAAKKLAHIVHYFDFRKPKAADLKDIFAGIAKTLKTDAEARHLVTFERGDIELASWVQWSVANGLKIETKQRQSPDNWRISIHAHVAIGQLKTVAKLAAKVGKSFASAWHSFQTKTHAPLSDRRVFFSGLYAGMMDDERKPGEQIAPPIVSRAKAPRGKQTVGAVAVHPYELAIILGRAMRLDTKPGRIEAMIEQATRRALAAKAA